VSKLDAHAFLVEQAETHSVGPVFEAWEERGGTPEAFAQALGDMRALPHVREWIRQMREAVRH
jgi:hypothetical protein